MANGFKEIESTDPAKLETFITGVTGSVMSIMDSLNSILYNKDAKDLPLVDYEYSQDLPYDTDISYVDIPDDPKVAFEQNAMKWNILSAKSQVKEMVDLVDSIAETAVVSQVEGEEMRTKAPMGMSMIMTKYDDPVSHYEINN